MRRIGLAVANVFVLTVLSAAPNSAWAQKGMCDDTDLEHPKAGDFAKLHADATAAYKLRKDPASLDQAIASWREAILVAPKNAEAYLALARALYLLGDGYQRLDGKDKEMILTLEEAVYFTERALRVQNPDFAFSICAQEPFMAKTVKLIRKADVPYMYWWATSLGKWGLAKSILKVLENRERIFGIMMRVRQLDGAYWWGAADRYLGAYYTKIPFPKGDLKRSKAHFEASLKRAPNYIATHVLMAELLAPKLKDREMFKTHLEVALKAKDDIVPELLAETLIEKRKAAKLMEDIDVLVPAAK